MEANLELVAVALLAVIAWSAYSAWRRHERGPIHPPFAPADVRFVERFASGFSHRNLFTRFGGFHNALVVRVLPDALLIEPLAVFKWLAPPGFNDLEHYVPIRDIVIVETRSNLGRTTTVKIQFRGMDGLPRTLELVLRKAQQFELAIGAG
jgi:hypothetical protein